MITSNNKWLIHTLLVGLIPVLTRLLTWATASSNVDPLAAADFITLGLIVHISIINEMEHVLVSEPAFKALLNGLSMLFITLYGTLYAVSALGEHHRELINITYVLYGSLGFCITSTTLGLVLFQRYANRSLQ